MILLSALISRNIFRGRRRTHTHILYECTSATTNKRQVIIICLTTIIHTHSEWRSTLIVQSRTICFISAFMSVHDKSHHVTMNMHVVNGGGRRVRMIMVCITLRLRCG